MQVPTTSVQELDVLLRARHLPILPVLLLSRLHRPRPV
jgi:hypothetical protein